MRSALGIQGAGVFDDVFRDLRKLERGVAIPMQMQLDDAGFLDRLCPNEQCGAEFKVLFEDWRDIVRDEAVFCPLCRQEAESGDWNTPEQDEQIQQEALRYAQGQLNVSFSSAARSFNRSQARGGLISMSMRYRPSSLTVVVPAGASDVLRQTYQCEKCNCRFSSLGAAFFCPACGHNSAISTLQLSLDTVLKTLDALPGIRQSVTDAADADVAENSVRHILENSLVKLVSSFQGFAEALFDTLPNRQQFAPRRNLFQNLRDSDDLWRSALGTGYVDMLSPTDYSTLGVFFQQRHLLAHKNGIVDQDYLDRSGDANYSLGQRLVIRTESVATLSELVEQLAREMGART
jgi:uncharacterized Zn finger protein (UPF0148 family)